MNEYDEAYWEETDLVLDFPRRNPYRTGVKTTAGVVFTTEEAREYFAMKSVEARRRQESHTTENMTAAVIGALAVIVMAVAALI